MSDFRQGNVIRPPVCFFEKNEKALANGAYWSSWAALFDIEVGFMGAVQTRQSRQNEKDAQMFLRIVQKRKMSERSRGFSGQEIDFLTINELSDKGLADFFSNGPKGAA